jgi:predicted DNA-binding protein
VAGVLYRCYTSLMPTAKQRISICPDERVLGALQALAKARGKPVASVSIDLIERALELEEDAHFSRIADERLAKGEKRVPHTRAWK